MKLYSSLVFELVISVALVGFVFTPSLAADDEVADLKAQVSKLQGEVETLKADNDNLRRESQSLRRIIADSQQQAKVSTSQKPVTVPVAVQSPATPQKSGGYWITTSSGVRHNSSCRYYMNSKGRACGPNEGRACKICGG